ncbi:MAG: ribonuclease R [Rhodospirillaceae bacterium]|nr:ribonuclease R [Rhodospirillaceae bacterium]
MAKPSPLSKRKILEFIKESPTPVGKREIARAFNIRGGARIALKAILKELQNEGHLDKERRRVRPSGDLPPVIVVEIIGTDSDGEVLCRPTRWQEDDPLPAIYLNSARTGISAPGPRDHLLVRVKKTASNVYEANTIRLLGKGTSIVVGVYERRGTHGTIRPTTRSKKRDVRIALEDSKSAHDGEVVTIEYLNGGHSTTRKARVVERIGPISDPKTYSLIAIHSREIPVAFDGEAMAQAESSGPMTLGKRTDLRDLPLVTIDGADARDFDDAVWAAPDEENSGGWRLVVAIADVASYVLPGDPLDKSAARRGTSVYFPDRVVPMLPEALSNGWCSLVPKEDRPCIAADIRIDAQGNIQSHRFLRGLMRSAARLTYEQVQAARDDRPDERTEPLLKSVIRPLYGAYEALLRGRDKRGTLDLNLAELQISLGENGQVATIRPTARLDSHRLIEEFMITANVAAAESLENKGAPVMYRIHEPPSPEKLEGLRQSLASLGYKLQSGSGIRPMHLGGILAQANDKGHEELVSNLILRSQSKAIYSPENAGHFGLALQRYCHFTSPIRRYPDILVHRALIAAHKLGAGSLTENEADRFVELGEKTSIYERRAEAAEREAKDRYITAFLSDRIGAQFGGRITGVTRFGLFVTLDKIGADGLVPIRTLPNDYYDHNETEHRLTGRDSGLTYTLGKTVLIKLQEANINTGGLVFELIEGGAQLQSDKRPVRKGKQRSRRKGRRRRQ